MNLTRKRPGFTLIETVLVLLLIALVLAMAAPSLRGWSRGTKLRDAADRFAAVTQWARMQAAAEAVIHRLEIDPSGGTYRVVRVVGQVVEPVDGEFGRTISMPDGVSLQLTTNSGAIEFHPTGRVSVASVRFDADWGESVEVASRAPSQPFRMVTATEKP